MKDRKTPNLSRGLPLGNGLIEASMTPPQYRGCGLKLGFLLKYIIQFSIIKFLKMFR